MLPLGAVRPQKAPIRPGHFPNARTGPTPVPTPAPPGRPQIRPICAVFVTPLPIAVNFPNPTGHTAWRLRNHHHLSAISACRHAAPHVTGGGPWSVPGATPELNVCRVFHRLLLKQRVVPVENRCFAPPIRVMIRVQIRARGKLGPWRTPLWRRNRLVMTLVEG